MFIPLFRNFLIYPLQHGNKFSHGASFKEICFVLKIDVTKIVYRKYLDFIEYLKLSFKINIITFDSNQIGELRV